MVKFYAFYNGYTFFIDLCKILFVDTSEHKSNGRCTFAWLIIVYDLSHTLHEMRIRNENDPRSF